MLVSLPMALFRFHIVRCKCITVSVDVFVVGVAYVVYTCAIDTYCRCSVAGVVSNCVVYVLFRVC